MSSLHQLHKVVHAPEISVEGLREWFVQYPSQHEGGSVFTITPCPGRPVNVFWGWPSQLLERLEHFDHRSVARADIVHRQETRAIDIQGKIRSLRKSKTRESGEVAVAESTFDVAIQVAAHLPYVDESPEVSTTPRGEVYFDWVSSKGILAISVCPPPDHAVVFAGRIGDERFSGRMPWSGTLPRLLECGLKALS